MAYYILKSYKLDRKELDLLGLLRRQRNCFFLDSSLNNDSQLGRYSFFGVDPFRIFKNTGSDPLPKLRRIFEEYNFSLPKSGLAFTGGAVGYLSYEAGFSIERAVSMRKKPGIGIPDCFFAFYNTVIIVDHYKNKLMVFSVGIPEKRYNLQAGLAKENFKKTKDMLCRLSELNKDTKTNSADKPASSLVSNFNKASYARAVCRAKQYIKAGDIYQVNLTQQFQTRTNKDAGYIYQRLRGINPTYFSAFFDGGDFQIISSSPESFLRLKNGLVVTRPMKGTRPRANNPSSDYKLKQQLLKSQKDKSELVMIVDLERNDLGRVCEYESIHVPKLRRIEKYNTVYQTTSSICGRLHKDKDRFDLIRASFPGGSITGCPKIRAMEIIDELEPNRRDAYTGCFGYLSFSGDMDLSILIRTILKKGDRVYFGSGGGIVADSHPISEYNESLVKAKAMMEALV